MNPNKVATTVKMIIVKLFLVFVCVGMAPRTLYNYLCYYCAVFVHQNYVMGAENRVLYCQITSKLNSKPLGLIGLWRKNQGQFDWQLENQRSRLWVSQQMDKMSMRDSNKGSELKIIKHGANKGAVVDVYNGVHCLLTNLFPVCLMSTDEWHW